MLAPQEAAESLNCQAPQLPGPPPAVTEAGRLDADLGLGSGPPWLSALGELSHEASQAPFLVCTCDSSVTPTHSAPGTL